MIKKVASVGAAAAVFLATASPAFATYNFPWWMMHRSEDTLTVDNRDTDVNVDVDVKADSGDNDVSGGSHSWGGWWMNMFGGGSSSELRTGDATVKEVGVMTDTNYTAVEGCGCFDDVTVKNHDTDVDVDVDVTADSGDNTLRGRGTLRTGAATVGMVGVSTFTNTTMVGGSIE